MYKLVLDEAGTFRTSESFEVYTENKLFYSDKFTDTLKRFGILVFNLPKGIYSVQGNISRCEYQKPKLPRLPIRRYNENIDNYELVRGDVKSKATIDHDNKKVNIDNSLYNMNPYTFTLILLHEKGHCYYDSETNADLYAVTEMLREGYNPSQIFLASIEGFTNPKSRYRINNILKTLEKL